LTVPGTRAAISTTLDAPIEDGSIQSRRFDVFRM